MASQEKIVASSRVDDNDLPEAQPYHEKEYHPQPRELDDVPRSPVAGFPDPCWQHSLPQANVTLRKRTLWMKKRFWLPVASLLLIAAVVGGTIGGLGARENSSGKLASTTSPTSTAETTNSTTATLLSSAPSPTPNPLNSSLASVSWTDGRGVGYRRLYYQDSAGTIKESAWNSSTSEWYISNEALGIARDKTALAAAVVGPRMNGFQLNVYYVNAAGRLVELYTRDTQSWSSGSLSLESITPSLNSDLAAIWTAYDGAMCNNCGEHDLILAYEDTNDRLQVVNATSSGLRYRTLDADPIPGSGLAISLQWHSQGSPGLRLYYQKGEDGIFSVDWESQEQASAPGDNAGDWTLHEDGRIGQASSGAPMASFSWGVDAQSGSPLLSDILSSGPQGIDVTWWTPQGWQDAKKPATLTGVQPYSALAANADRHVYALESGSVREFVVSTDGVNWSVVGNVPTKN